ncbi:MAG: hypothetical protein RLZZ414_1991 [Bacteroidota bacterium]|jgi:hypothetical protein
MPYTSEKIKIEGTQFDRRRKLSEEDKKDISENVLGLSQRQLAIKYSVSRRTIQFIIDPNKLEENLKRRAERGGSKKYYKPDEWAETMREHRKYKQNLKLQGKI